MSKHQSIKNHLAPWLRVSTWYTGHPLDEERFHKALGACFRDIGPSIAFDEFEQAMVELLEEHHPTSHATDSAERVHDWAAKAEVIGSYLFDNGQRA